MKRRWRWIAGAIVLVLVVAYGLVSYLIASGITKADRKPQEDDPSRQGLAHEEVEFTPRGEDIRLSGWYLPPPGDGPVVIFVHGWGSKRSGDEAVTIAARLVPRGYGVLLFDLRGHGGSEGGRVSGGFFERRDVLGAFDHVASRGVPPNRIGLLGFSGGAATAIFAAAEEPAIQAIVADSPYAKASEFFTQEIARKTVLPRWVAAMVLPTVWLMARGLYDVDIGDMVPERSMRRIHQPILVIHGDADRRIPYQHGERVHRAARPGSELWLVHGADHVDAFKVQPDEYIERVDRYFRERLHS